MIHPQHLSSDGVHFFGIKGSPVHYPVIRGEVKGNCFSFTTQNPTDKNDTDDFELCATAPGRGTLKTTEAPGIEPWPVTREKGPLVVAVDWDSKRRYLQDDTGLSNPEMKKIFDEDQRVRQPASGNIDWAVVSKSDADRREATRKLLADGKLHTGEDFERAAFLFQHGDSPDDYLLAHTLASIAMANGQSSAIWIASATLDRYLQSIHQPQIYGTQFLTPTDMPATQEPYNRALISDALRRQLSVPSLAAQEKQRQQYDAQRSHEKN